MRVSRDHPAGVSERERLSVEQGTSLGVHRVTQYDAIVVGVGGMGSSTVYHLARREMRVLGVEQYDIPNEMGSSHGITRVIRLAYFEHPSYVPLLRKAYELWREIENVTGERVLIITGSVDAGAEGSDIIRGSLESCEQHHLPHEVMDAGALHRRFPGYRLPGDMVAVYQPDGGFVLSERSIATHVMAAQALGAEIHARERVVSWEPHGERVQVHTDRGVYTASRLVITAGPWAGHLLPELGRLAVPERQVVLWAQPLRPAYFRVGTFPVFNLHGPEGRFYGYPMYGEIPGFKIGKYHHRHEMVDPDRVTRDVVPEDEAVLREGIHRYFPDADGPVMAMKVCLFTNSPDEHFILDRHPQYPQVCVAAGFSGHGFKFCSVVGSIMAELAVEGASHMDISLFRLRRFISAEPDRG